MSEHAGSMRRYVNVFLALQGLLALTVVVRYLPLGNWHLPTTLLIASLKAFLVVLYFMHVQQADRVTKLAACIALAWLAILMGLTTADYISRGNLLIPGK